MLDNDVAFSGQLRDKTVLTSTLKSLQDQRHKCLQDKDYDRAQAAWHAQHAAIADDHRIVRDKEKKRQKMEVQRLKRAATLMKDKHDKEWEEILLQAEDRWNSKRSAILDKHRNELEQLELEIERKERMKHNIHSSYVRDMLQVEQKLAEGHQYEESKMLRRKIQKQEEEERVAFLTHRQEVKDRQIQRLLERQEDEIKQLEKHIKNERVMLQRKAHTAHKTLLQTTSNLKADMVHAHVVEIQRIASANVSVPPLQQKRLHKKKEQRIQEGTPHGCAPGQVATYRGSQLLLKMQGKYPLVSLCALYDPDNPGPPQINPLSPFALSVNSSRSATLSSIN